MYLMIKATKPTTRTAISTFFIGVGNGFRVARANSCWKIVGSGNVVGLGNLPSMRRTLLALLALLALIVACNGGTATTSPPSVTGSNGSSTTTTESTLTTAATAVTSTSTPTTTESTVTSSTSSVADETVVVEVEVAGGASSAAGQTVNAKIGQQVLIRVASDAADEVHLHGYDLKVDVAAGSSAEIEFVADIPGVFEVELEEAGLLLFELAVSP